MSDSASIPELIPVTEAAERMGVSKATAYRMLKDGDFPVRVVKIGGRQKVSRKAVDAWLASLALELDGEAS